MGLRLDFLPWFGSGAAGQGQAVSALALEASFERLQVELAGRIVHGHQLRVIAAARPASTPMAADAPLVWYCQGPGPYWYRAIARCQRRWLRWQVNWQLQTVNAEQLRSALRHDPQASQRILGKLKGQRLYA